MRSNLAAASRHVFSQSRLKTANRTDPILEHDGLSQSRVFGDSHVDEDPYYSSPELFAWLCEGADVSCTYPGEWGHPRGQHLLGFTKLGWHTPDDSNRPSEFGFDGGRA